MQTSTTRAKVDGFQVLFNMAVTKRQALLDELTKIGKEGYCPPPRADTTCLKMCLDEFARDYKKGLMDPMDGKWDVTVEPLKDRREDGFEVRQVKRRSDKVIYDGNGARRLLIAKVKDSVVSLVENPAYAPSVTIQSTFDRYKSELGKSELGQAVIAILKATHSQVLREDGGVYYLPANYSQEFVAAANAFETANPKSMITISQVVMDTSLKRCVMHFVAADLEKAVKEIEGELDDLKAVDRDEIPAHLKKRRVDKLLGYAKFAEEYEEILGSSLAQSKQAIAQAVVAVNTAAPVPQQDDATFQDVDAQGDDGIPAAAKLVMQAGSDMFDDV